MSVIRDLFDAVPGVEDERPPETPWGVVTGDCVDPGTCQAEGECCGECSVDS